MSEPGENKAQARLISLDAYRGFTMLAMASGGLALRQISDEDPLSQNVFLEKLVFQLDHAEWRGCSFWDLIQPSFMFIVGAAIPFSLASRKARGHSWGRLLAHTLWRSLVLVLLGVFLASQGRPSTTWEFTNVLAQIGLGYTFVFLLSSGPPALAAVAVALILIGYWALFARYPLPGPDFPWHQVGISPGWNGFEGFAAHWEKNANVAAAFDRWFLNLFPRPGGKPFMFNPGGYTTLNFVPSMATMLLGSLAGRLLRSQRTPKEKLVALLIAGTLGIAIGSSLDPDYCPMVKRIWTPSWTLYSAGWAAFQLGIFYWLIDIAGFRRWAFPLVVVGLNSITMYLLAQLTRPWVRSSLTTHLGPKPFAGLYGPAIQSAAVLFVWWLICYWMYRRKIFIKI